ncbi:cytochrome c oxidase assembly protein [soil metagenome]
MTTPNKKKSQFRLLAILSLSVVGMFLFGYALVPLYTVMCQTMGINGKPNKDPEALGSDMDSKRTITVQFLASNNAAVPWQFYPTVYSVKVHPGENKQVSFFAQNDSDHTMTIQAIPSITPSVAAKYFKKTECFCFKRQTFSSKMSMDMPLLFHIDKDIPKNVDTVTLAYTLFDASRFAVKEPKTDPHGRTIH